MFRLAKWYLDVVADDGTLLIAYVAQVQWSGASARLASTLLARPGEEPAERITVSEVEWPSCARDTLRWSHRGLAVSGCWSRRAAPVRQTLLDRPAGLVQWDCAMPAADVAVEVAGAAVAGRGYAECLVMTLPPWQLPLSELRWGRWVSPRHAAVWIAWHGREVQHWTWLDGAAQPRAVASDHGVDGLEDGGRLAIAPVRDICDRRALHVLSRDLPSLPRSLLGPLADLRETKRLGRGTLHGPAGPPEDGWVVHEVVTW